jgi:hypothetical protein
MATKRSLTDEEIRQRIPGARAREKDDRETGLRAVKAFYDVINELVMIETTRGFRWGIPKARIPAIKKASPEDLVQLTLSPSGTEFTGKRSMRASSTPLMDLARP